MAGVLSKPCLILWGCRVAVNKTMAFRRFVREWEHPCECGNRIRLKRELITIHKASRGEASYLYFCEACGSSGFGFFGSTDFVNNARVAVERYYQDSGLPKPAVRCVRDIFVDA
jgi:hypothetical protein